MMNLMKLKEAQSFSKHCARSEDINRGWLIAIPIFHLTRRTSILTKLNTILNNFEEYLGVFSLIFTSVLVFIQVVMRYLFNYSIYWSEEVARYIIIWFIFIGSSIAVREKAHATVDLLINYLPQVYKRLFSILAALVSVIFCLLIIISSWKTIGNVVEYGSVTPSLGIPMYIPYLAIPVGSTLMLIRFVQVMWDNIKQLHIPEEAGKEGN